MTPFKLNVFFAFFAYAGNGGISCEHPGLRVWFAKLMRALDKDERIGRMMEKTFMDTPITMTRNGAVMKAREFKADVLVMIDSDMEPDLYLGRHPTARPFFQSSFDFLYKHYQRGPCAIFAPYCGPPPHPTYGGMECVYMFRWTDVESGTENPLFALQKFSREDAAMRSGFEQVDAAPTGLSMFDMRMFELTEPKDTRDKPWFYYEWTDKYQQAKGSTEDVTATRDMALACQVKHGYNGVYSNWDAWAGHMKTKCVGKPVVFHGDTVASKFVKAVQDNFSRDERIVDWGAGDDGASHPEDNMAARIGWPGKDQEEDCLLDPANLAAERLSVAAAAKELNGQFSE